MHSQTAIAILQVDDDFEDANVLRRLLDRLDGQYTLDHACTLAEGLTRAETGDYQVIFTDLGLPDASGLEAIQRLNLACPEAAVIAHSGLDEEYLRIEALTQGADDFLSKHDLNAIALQRCVSENLHRTRLRENIRCLYHAVQEEKETVEAQAEKLALQATELAQQNRKLKKLCDSSQKFVNNVSHEFRTPLCVVKQYSSLLADGIVGDVNVEQKRMLQVIEDRVDDLNNMVDDMLDISRHESGMLAAAREHCQVAAVVERILPVLHQRAKLHDIEIQADLPADLPITYCDPEKVTRTLINLAINAIKFSPAGSTVHIRLRSEESAKQVRIAVQDQGPGIASDQTQQIFKRFNRLHQAQAVPKTGFGLGLNIAEELVELNLGQISLESVVGEGSTFSFTVPVADWPEVLHRHLQRVAQDEQEQEASIQISVIRASLVQPLSDAACQQGPKEIQAFLNCLLFSKDLLLPMEDDVWLVVLTAGRSGAECFLERIGKETESVNRNRAQGALPELKLEDLGTVVGAENLDSLQQLLTRNAPALTCSAQRGTLCAI